MFWDSIKQSVQIFNKFLTNISIISKVSFNVYFGYARWFEENDVATNGLAEKKRKDEIGEKEILWGFLIIIFAPLID